MPNFFEWQNLRNGQYAVGLEPSSHHVGGDGAAREDGSMIWLEHGESREYRTTIRILRGLRRDRRGPRRGPRHRCPARLTHTCVTDRKHPRIA